MANGVERFIHWLTQEVAEDRAVRADLRRGLGQPPGYASHLTMHIARQGMQRWQENIAYVVAPLFALHPMNTDSGNMGDHLMQLRLLRKRELHGMEEQALERRFGALLAAHEEELDVYLRQLISMLKQKDIPVNWRQLFWDIWAWKDPDKQAEVRRQWAKSFFESKGPETGTDESESTDSVQEE